MDENTPLHLIYTNHTGYRFLFGSIRDLGRIFEIPGNGVCITKDSTYRQEIPTLKSMDK